MIIGIVAANDQLGGAVNTLDPSAYVFMDFENGVYGLNGVSMSVEDMIDSPSLVVASSGLRCDWNTSNPPVRFLEAALAAARQTSLTIVIEWTPQDTYNAGYLIWFEEDSTNYAYYWVEDDNTYLAVWADTVLISSATAFVTATEPHEFVRRKIAFNVQTNSCNISLNGGAPYVPEITSSSGVSNQWDLIVIGGTNPASFFDVDAIIHSIKIYPGVANSQLSTLSAF